jgi:hypothetical protein
MIEMNPYYAHESSVGPVFDLTQWTGRGILNAAVCGLLFGAVIIVAAVFVYEPGWFVDKKKPPQALKEMVVGIQKAHKTHAWAMRGGIVLAALFGGACVAGSVAMLSDTFRRDYYFRAGPGGLSLRMPGGVSWSHFGFVSKLVELELAWDEIASTTITQTRYVGAMSRNAGNISAEIKIVTRSGENHRLSLEGLEAAGYLVHQRLEEMRDMVPANLEPAETMA